MNVSPKEIHDGLIMVRVSEHFENSKLYFPESRIVGLFLQGSQNYGLDYEGSDVDTKLIVTPTFEDIVFNKKPISTTHILENEEHVDWKDVRLYMNTFVKQNLNFLEILFTNFKIINPMYQEAWNLLERHREEIARMNPYRAVKSMKGIAMEKYHAMEHEYPSKLEVLAKWGYDPKQLHHLLRVEEYIGRYINGEPYENCLRPHNPEYLIDVKRGYYDLETAHIVANTAMTNITRIADNFCTQTEDRVDEFAQAILNKAQYDIIRIAIGSEIKEN